MAFSAAHYLKLQNQLNSPLNTASRSIGVCVLESRELPVPDGGAVTASVRLHTEANEKNLTKVRTGEQLARVGAGGTGHGSNVQWGDQFTFGQGVPAAHATRLTLKVTTTGSGSVGEVTISFAQHIADGRPHDLWLPLRRSRHSSEADLDRGWIHVVVLYSVLPRLQVTVVAGSELCAAHSRDPLPPVRVVVRKLARCPAVGADGQQAQVGVGGGSGGGIHTASPTLTEVEFTSRPNLGHFPAPVWGDTFSLPATAGGGADEMLELECLAAGVSLGRAKRSFGSLRQHTTFELLQADMLPQLAAGLEFSDYQEAICATEDFDELHALVTELGLDVAFPLSVRAMQLQLQSHYSSPKLHVEVRHVMAEPDWMADSLVIEHTGCPEPLARPVGVVMARRIPPILGAAERYRTLQTASVRSTFQIDSAAPLMRVIHPGATLQIAELRLGPQTAMAMCPKCAGPFTNGPVAESCSKCGQRNRPVHWCKPCSYKSCRGGCGAGESLVVTLCTDCRDRLTNDTPESFLRCRF